MHLLLVTVLSAIQLSAAVTKTHMVYWNSTNPIFRIDNTDHIVDVNEGNLPWEYDQLNIICPQNSLEQHVIYSVSQDEFESCRVTNPRPKIVAICNKPEEFQYFTITFRNFSPTPGGLEFRPGQNYYLISTSTRRDLHRRVGGFCSSHNMKVMFKVLASSADSKADEGAALESKDQSSSVREAEGGGGRRDRPAVSLLVTTLCLTYFTHWEADQHLRQDFYNLEK